MGATPPDWAESLALLELYPHFRQPHPTYMKLRRSSVIEVRLPPHRIDVPGLGFHTRVFTLMHASADYVMHWQNAARRAPPAVALRLRCRGIYLVTRGRAVWSLMRDDTHAQFKLDVNKLPQRHSCCFSTICWTIGYICFSGCIRESTCESGKK